MRKFSYEARDNRTNKIVKSTVSAESEQAAAKVLVSQGMNPITINDERMTRADFFDRITNRITTKDKVIFTRQLSTLIEAGLPITQSLQTVLEQTQNRRMRTVIEDVIESVEGGKTLRDSFASHPDVFSRLFLALVSVGEASGTLDKALLRIADQQEKDGETMSKIRGALTYPVIVFVVIVAVMIFMLVTVVPQVEKLYHDLHKSLPFITQVMVSMATFVTQWWWVFVIALVAAGYFGQRYVHTDAGRASLDRFKLNLPLFSALFRNLYIARFARTGETLLESGVAMLDMLTIAGDAVDNTVIKGGVERAAEKVQGGKALSTALKPQEYIPELLPQMIKIGEESGQIGTMLGKSAKIYEDELNEQIRTISTSIEPILMVVLALFAGGMVGAVLMPIYSLAGNLQM